MSFNSITEIGGANWTLLGVAVAIFLLTCQVASKVVTKKAPTVGHFRLAYAIAGTGVSFLIFSFAYVVFDRTHTIERKVLDWTVDKTFGCVLKNQSWTVLSYVETDSSEPSHAYFARSGNSINFGTMLAKPKAIPDVSDATKYRSFIEIRMDMTNPDPKVPAHRVDPSSFDFGVVVIQRASDPLRFLTKQKARDLKLLPADCE